MRFWSPPMVVMRAPASTAVRAIPGEVIPMSMELDARYWSVSGSVRVTSKSTSRLRAAKPPRCMAIQNGHCELTFCGDPMWIVVRWGVGVAAAGTAARTRASAAARVRARAEDRRRIQHLLDSGARSMDSVAHGVRRPPRRAPSGARGRSPRWRRSDGRRRGRRAQAGQDLLGVQAQRAADLLVAQRAEGEDADERVQAADLLDDARQLRAHPRRVTEHHVVAGVQLLEGPRAEAAQREARVVAPALGRD